MTCTRLVRSTFNKHKNISLWSLALFLAAALLVLLNGNAQGAIYYWDNNGAAAGFGTAGGTWGSSAFWNTNGTGNPAPAVTNTNTADDVNFGNGATGLAAGTVLVTGAAQQFSTMTFASGSGAISISGGTLLTMAAASTITVHNASNGISTALAGGATSLTKAGAGTLTLNGANTYTGATNVSGGTLVLSSVGSIPAASTTTVASTGTLNIAANTAGGRTFSNNIVLTGGTVQGVLDNIGSGGTIVVGDVSGNVTHTFTGSGSLTIPMAVTANGGVVVGGGGGGGGGRGSTGNRGGGGGGGRVSLLSGSAIAGGTTSVTVGGGGGGGVQGVNSGTGGGAGGTSSLGAILTAAGGDFGKGTGTNYAGGASGSGNAGGAASGLFGGGGGGNGGAASGTTPGPGTTVAGVTYGAGALGSGVAAGGANTGNGGGGGAPGNGVASGAGGSGIVIVQYAYAQSAGTVTLSGSIDLQQASTLDAFGAGGLLIVSGIMQTTTGPGGITIASSNNPGGVIRFDTLAKTYAGDTAVNGGVNSATLRMGLANAMPFGIGKGNLVLNGAGAGTAGTFDLNNFDTGVNGLDGTTGSVPGQVVNNSGGALKTLTVGNGDASGSFAGVIRNNTTGTGTIALIKTGSGTQTLGGADTYTGTTTINNGTLVRNGTHTPGGGAGNYTVNAGGTLKGSGVTNGDLLVIGGTVAPGSSIESLGVGSISYDAGLFEYELDTDEPNLAIAADLLYGDDNSTLTLLNNPALSLIDLGSNTALAPGTKFTLIAYDGVWNGGLFSGYADDSTFSFAGNTWL
ncbi:MAG: autotransporter-associated beta strand repeat-containing protein, partial [Planctomycetes bacterium]|nr:autotransporter-associated beta strand repeat-containing protein [Planctomycetota bacterium]